MAFKKLTYLAGGADGKIAVKTSLRAIGGVEVLIKVTHSGLCGTDVHDRTAGCGLGHEGVGIIENVGNEVTSAKLGHRVGWGWQFAVRGLQIETQSKTSSDNQQSCGLCRECLSGYRQYCPESCGQKYGELEQGAFGDYVVKHQDFVYPIPDEIESKYAGPLNCAGVSLRSVFHLAERLTFQITVYEALHAADTKPSDRVGIVGFGGLGHIAVMYAHAMGCAVTVFSSSDDKRADAMVLGATEFCLLSGSESSPKLTSDINVLLLCGNGLPNFDM